MSLKNVSVSRFCVLVSDAARKSPSPRCLLSLSGLTTAVREMPQIKNFAKSLVKESTSKYACSEALCPFISLHNASEHAYFSKRLISLHNHLKYACSEALCPFISLHNASEHAYFSNPFISHHNHLPSTTRARGPNPTCRPCQRYLVRPWQRYFVDGHTSWWPQIC